MLSVIRLSFNLIRRVHTVPVLYEILHVEVIDEQRIPKFSILHSFVQGETWKTQHRMVQKPVALALNVCYTAGDTMSRWFPYRVSLLASACLTEQAGTV